MEVQGQLQAQHAAHKARLARMVKTEDKPVVLQPIEYYWRQMWFGDLIWPKPHSDKRIGPPRIEEIQNAVCEHFGVTKIDLQSQCRVRKIAVPRMIAIYLCRELTPKSFPNIGRMFGDRDHTTALHSHRTIAKKIPQDEVLAANVATLRARLA